MARISKIFRLNATQLELDFVDIDISKDTPLFIDPHFLTYRNDAFSREATAHIKSFFQNLIDLIKAKKLDEALASFSNLKEPNETCLGMSTGTPRGRSVNQTDVNAIFNNLVSSAAIASGLVEDLQDTFLFVDGIGRDKLSDMTTCIIRNLLIEYTQVQASNLGIELQDGVSSEPYWSRANNEWEHRHTKMLVIEDRKILLVPKGIVCYSTTYTPAFYHQHFVLNFHQSEQLRLRTTLVKKRENKSKKTIVEYVTKDDVRENISPGDKIDLTKFSIKHPKVFAEFKAQNRRPSNSIKNHDFETNESDPKAVSSYLIDRLNSLQAGRKDADAYEDVIMCILEFLMYPDLIAPQKQTRIHGGRKRIDITFDNAAYEGTFLNFHARHGIPCPYIMVECKNYSEDPKNPEFDQLSGRFSPNRGKIGLLVFRTTTSMDKVMVSCSDTMKDDRGLIIPVCDEDLIASLEQMGDNANLRPLNDILEERSRKIRIN